MNRDAKIGIVVILIIVGLLVIIWGRGEREDEIAVGPGPIMGPILENNLEPGDRLLSPGMSATVPEPDILDDDALVIPPDDDTAVAPVTDPALVAPPAEPLAPKTWEYTVASGDTLEIIARNQLGDAKRFREIATLNKLANPDMLRIGQKLKMPAKGSAPTVVTTTTTPAPTAVEAPKITRTRRYTVKPGDLGIYQIAQEQLGDGSKWNVIAELNHLKKPFDVMPGQELLLPE